MCNVGSRGKEEDFFYITQVVQRLETETERSGTTKSPVDHGENIHRNPRKNLKETKTGGIEETTNNRHINAWNYLATENAHGVTSWSSVALSSPYASPTPPPAISKSDDRSPNRTTATRSRLTRLLDRSLLLLLLLARRKQCGGKTKRPRLFIGASPGGWPTRQGGKVKRKTRVGQPARHGVREGENVGGARGW